jgi:glycosyltransferase involved in cell wall biosynthesis
MRVLFINYELPPLGAGAGNATANIARCLAAAGVEVLIVTSRFRGLPANEQVDGYRIRRVPAFRRRLDRCSAPEMLSFIVGGIAPVVAEARRFRPHVICCFFGIPSGPLALLLRQLYGVPYLVSLRGGDVPGFLSEDLAVLHRLTTPIIHAVWRRSQGLIANSDGLARLALRTCPEVTVDVIPNGVDVETFRPPGRKRPAQPMRLLLVGRLVRQKAVSCVLRALAKARAPTVLRVVGDGPERAELSRLAAELGVAGRVEFTGWASRAELPAHYEWADVFVLPSLEEGLSNAVLEALASGLPIVTTEVDGNRDVVTSENGILVEPGDTDAIAFAIDQLAGDPATLRDLATASRRSALGRRWESVADAYHGALAAIRRGEEPSGTAVGAATPDDLP